MLAHYLGALGVQTKFLVFFIVAFVCANADVTELENKKSDTDGSNFNLRTSDKIKDLNGENPAPEAHEWSFNAGYKGDDHKGETQPAEPAPEQSLPSLPSFLESHLSHKTY